MSAARSEERRLYLLRHAKSSWSDPGLADHDRPLAPRGRRAAILIGEHLRSAQIAPQLVLCSSACRAVETLEYLRLAGKVEVEPELYGASPDELLDRLRVLPDELGAVMLIGHNPSIQELAAGLAAGDSGLSERRYPTGALAVLTFAGPWSSLRPQRANLVEFVRPRDLT
ncbi:MAG TPA: histidine phosphatase family protein [Solirubrobacteraceae bacterium]|nr:histidine phosphatase family protein [Solirubrobacteraceae bacterium]